MTPRLQNLLIFLGIIIIAGLGYYLYTQKNGISLNNSAVDNTFAAESALFLTHLTELKTITLEGKIFHDPRFTSLRNYSQPTVPLPIGRDNPFIGSN